MEDNILSGKVASAALLDSLRDQVAKLDPKLVVVQVGEDPASSSYIKQKFKSCEKVGMRSEHMHLPSDTTLQNLMHCIDELNSNPDVSGFIVQLPLPDHLSPYVPDIIRAIDPSKDVDGFGAYNLGKMLLSADYEDLPPATPSGIIYLLEHYGIDVAGKHAVVVGRSNIVGKPIATMLLNRSATVTVCHSKTPNLADFTRQADIIVAAVGRAKMITADMVKDGVVIIDVGMNRVDDGLCGDVDFEAVAPKAAGITPVPGGVGPMTVASLMRNCVRAKERQMDV